MKKCLLGIGVACFAAIACFAAEISVNLLPTGRTSSQTGALRAVASLSTDEDVVREHRLGAGAASVQNLSVGDVLILALFDDRDVRIELVSEERSCKGRAFLGRDMDGLGLVDCVVLETESGLVIDVTDSKNNRVWKVISDENGVQVKEIKPTQRMILPSNSLQPPPLGAPIPVLELKQSGSEIKAVTNRVISSPNVSLPAVTDAALMSGIAMQTAAVALPATVLPTVDIMVAYDTQAASWAKTNGGGLQSFAETCVQKMNTAIANTGLKSKFSFRLVAVHEIGASSGTDFNYALECASGTAVSSEAPAAWSAVAVKRNETFADIVCVLIDTGSASGTTGLGWSLMPESDPAFCGCNASAIRAVNQSHTMTHEVGHNMGAGHSNKQKSSPGPQYHSYSSGYYFTANGKKYYTIMAYNSDGYGNYYDPVPYFSSPDYTYGGVRVGSDVNNNTKTISQTYLDVVNNRREPFVSAEVGVGLDAEGYEWTTDGTYPWARATDRSSDGVDSASSCLIKRSAGTTSWTETRVVGPATLSFSYFMRSAGGVFRVTCDGSTLFTKGSSGANTYMYSWDTASNLSIPSGMHTIRFAHVNNSSSYYEPANAVWVDKVVFSGGSSPSQTFTISFDAHGGIPTPSPITRKANEAYGTLPTPTRVGYRFDGWYTAASGGTEVSSTTKATASTTLHAHWTANKYTVSYSLGSNGAHGSNHPSSATYDTSFYVSAPTRSGYTFAGWTVTSGLNTSTAKWGTSSSPATAVGTATKCVNGAAGNVYFKNLTAASGGSVTLTANWTANATIPLATALDTTLSFTTGGNASWVGQREQTHDGVSAAQSGTIGNNQESWMKTSVSGPGIISFWWKVSSEANYDYLELLVDGTVKKAISGLDDTWVRVSQPISGTGTHEIEWRYRKDISSERGRDAGFVDQVEWTDNVVNRIDEYPGYRGNLYFMYLSKDSSTFFYVDDSDLIDMGIDISKGVTSELMNGVGRNGLPRYQSLLFGLEPESPIPAEEQLKTTITFDASGRPIISCSPKNENNLITYTPLGKSSLNSSQWTVVTDSNRALMKFFKVKVELKKGN